MFYDDDCCHIKPEYPEEFRMSSAGLIYSPEDEREIIAGDCGARSFDDDNEDYGVLCQARHGDADTP